MAGEGDIDDRRTYPVVLDDIHDRRGQEACLPAEGTPWLKDEVKVRVALLEGSEHTD